MFDWGRLSITVIDYNWKLLHIYVTFYTSLVMLTLSKTVSLSNSTSVQNTWFFYCDMTVYKLIYTCNALSIWYAIHRQITAFYNVSYDYISIKNNDCFYIFLLLINRHFHWHILLTIWHWIMEKYYLKTMIIYILHPDIINFFLSNLLFFIFLIKFLIYFCNSFCQQP